MPEPPDELVHGALHKRLVQSTHIHNSIESQIVKRYLGGASQRELAAEFRVNRSVVRRVLREHGIELHQPVLSERRVDEVRRLYENGMSTRALAERFGVGKSTVVRFMREHGVGVRNRPLSSPPVES